ncbi:hypothetical protein [Citrobacter youngae]|uniref:hypothetical protein n=1 Tax=Citrobacter youngae TaxID=133448 RepID=UPI00397B29C3
MTTNKLTDELVEDSELQMLIDSHEKGTAMFMRVNSYYLMAKELQERRKADSQAQATLNRLAVILHGSEVDLNLLTVTAQSLMDRCKAATSSDL